MLTIKTKMRRLFWVNQKRFSSQKFIFKAKLNVVLIFYLHFSWFLFTFLFGSKSLSFPFKNLELILLWSFIAYKTFLAGSIFDFVHFWDFCFVFIFRFLWLHPSKWIFPTRIPIWWRWSKLPSYWSQIRWLNVHDWPTSSCCARCCRKMP